MDIQQRLLSMRDESYAAFQRKLIPTLEGERILGVRTPDLRTLAKGLAGTREGEAFLARLPHHTFEENQLHSFLLCREKDYSRCIERLERFLPYVDNWATCDQLSPPVLGKHLPELMERIRLWLSSHETYTVRFGIGMLMRWFLEDAFRPEYLGLAADVRSDAYYVNMMVAWFFATALAKQYDATLPYLEAQRLEPWTHNKTIQKAVESNRIPPERKQYLRSLKTAVREAE